MKLRFSIVVIVVACSILAAYIVKNGGLDIGYNETSQERQERLDGFMEWDMSSMSDFIIAEEGQCLFLPDEEHEDKWFGWSKECPHPYLKLEFIRDDLVKR